MKRVLTERHSDKYLETNKKTILIRIIESKIGLQ